MSRGHGWVQLKVLAVLKTVAEGGGLGTPVPLSLIVPAVYSNPQPERKHTESVRRALKKLAAEEQVILTYEVLVTDGGVTGGVELAALVFPTEEPTKEPRKS